MPRECSFCDVPATKKCSGSGKIYYCSQECQRKGWARHIFDCNRTKPIPTAYYLRQAAFGDVFPEDPQTCEDYGFTKALVVHDQIRLLGLYRGIFVHMEVEPRDMHRWHKNGTLVQEIKKLYEKIPVTHRGQYYPWFLENQHVLDPSWTPPADMGEGLMKQVWNFIGGDPNVTSNHWDVVKTWSTYKHDCFRLFYMLFHHWHPSPDFDLWVDFGFCVCRSQWEERILSRIYETIIINKKCPLEEFTAAYESNTLYKLFQKYGVGDDVKQIRYLDHIIDSVGRESAWDLKAWACREQLQPAIPSIEVDYGMINAMGNDEYLNLLRRIYKSVFEHPKCDPVELHQACIQGKTFEYVEGLLKIKKEAKLLRVLMKNVYPLQEM